MNEPDIARWTLIRDVLVFQVKLAMDAIRDLLLSPVSIICGLIDILRGHSLAESYFHKLMDYGHETDVWINLFDHHNKEVENLDNIDSQKAKAEVNVDQLISQIESVIKEQHSKGGLTVSAKAVIDSYLNKIVENKMPSDKQ